MADLAEGKAGLSKGDLYVKKVTVVFNYGPWIIN
jgi:hypothetical protein